MISSDLVLLRKLQRDDVDKMELWGEHKEVSMLHYNFPTFTKWEKDIWYKMKAKQFFKRCYAIIRIEDNYLMGYISVRNYNLFSRSAELGIVMDPSLVNNGYGTEALTLLTKHLLKKPFLKALKLHVALYNTRALKCYENVGFKVKYKVIREFENQNMGEFIKMEILRENDVFELKRNKLYTQYYLMEIKQAHISTKTVEMC